MHWRERLVEHLQHHSPHTKSAILASAACIARQLSAESPNIHDAVQRAVRDKARCCPRSLPQVTRRIYAAANLVWHDLLGHLSHPLKPPPAARTPPTVELPPRTFTEAEVEALTKAAANISPLALALIRLLFTTGIRISAAAALTWSAVLDPDGSGVARMAVVREKGGVSRVVLLCRLTREALWTIRSSHTRVLPRSVRQLRNIFYKVCRAANIHGPHCHPHAARHYVAHALFAAGNPVCLIAKYLGHRSLATTNAYYLRLSFAEVTARMHIPWEQ